jgi:hypothetical protein
MPQLSAPVFSKSFEENRMFPKYLAKRYISDDLLFGKRLMHKAIPVRRHGDK